MAHSPYKTDPDLTGIAISYYNTDYIADEIAPYERVRKKEFEYDEYPIEQLLTPIDDSVGRLSRPNQVTFASTRLTDKVEDHALDSPVTQEDIDDADNHQDPLRQATIGTMELVKLNREIRVKNIVFNLNTYLPELRETLSGTSQWSDPNSTPIKDISSAKDKMFCEGKYLVLGQVAWTALRTNPEIVEGVLGTGAKKGNVSRQAVAELLELDGVLVGKSRQNYAKPGQTANIARLWGNHAALIHKNPLARLKSVGGGLPTFMITARWGTPISGTIPDPNLGASGGIYVRAGEKVKEKVLSQYCGYFFQNAVAAP